MCKIKQLIYEIGYTRKMEELFPFKCDDFQSNERKHGHPIPTTRAPPAVDGDTDPRTRSYKRKFWRNLCYAEIQPIGVT